MNDLTAKDVKKILDKVFRKSKKYTKIHVKKDKIDEFITQTRGAG